MFELPEGVEAAVFEVTRPLPDVGLLVGDRVIVRRSEDGAHTFELYRRLREGDALLAFDGEVLEATAAEPAARFADVARGYARSASPRLKRPRLVR